jgi:hypothetical protein
MDYSALRQLDWFVVARDEELEDSRFWCLNQKLIYEQVYRTMSQRVCYMHVLDRTHLRKKFEYFGDALQIMKRLGLFHLMDIQCHYNEKIIQQFYATLSFGKNEALTFKWMTGDKMRQSDLYEFAKLLNYGFQGFSVPVGHRVHQHGAHPDKNCLAPLYSSSGKIGTIVGLLPLYNILLRMFRESISPARGNRDAIRLALVELTYLSHRCYMREDPNEDFSLDVMHYIFNEMHDARISKRTPPYALYIMLLILEKVKDMDFSKGNSEHKIKRMNVIKPKEEKKKKEAQARGKKHVPEDDDDVEMDDPSSPVHKTSTAGTFRSKKKFSWWQHTLLCMNLAIHKENYAAYEEGKATIHNQKSLFREIQLIQDPTAQLSLVSAEPTYTPYAQWQDDNGVDWAQLEALT